MILSKFRKTLTVLATVIGACAAVSAYAADDYPIKPIQVVLPIAPGGDTDVNARIFSKYLQEELGRPIAIVNIDGAGGTIGMRRVKAAKPDGYTAMFFHGEAMVPELAGLTDINLDDFQMVAVALVDNTTVLVTHKDTPYENMQELADHAQANPDEITFGMLTGGFPHLVGVALNQELGADTTLVDVGGNAAKIVALRGKKVDVINTQYQLAKDYFETGDFVNLGLLSKERNELIPDVVTTAEQGFPLEFNKFFFFAMPEGTPMEVVSKFSEAVKRVVENEDYRAEASKFYLTPTYMDPAQATEHAKAQYEVLLQYKDLFVNQ